MGTNTIRSGGQRYQYERIISHTNYNRPRLANDIALILVRGKINFNDKVQPIPLDYNVVPVGTRAQAFGWGLLYVNSISIQFLISKMI